MMNVGLVLLVILFGALILAPIVADDINKWIDKQRNNRALKKRAKEVKNALGKAAGIPDSLPPKYSLRLFPKPKSGKGLETLCLYDPRHEEVYYVPNPKEHSALAVSAIMRIRAWAHYTEYMQVTHKEEALTDVVNSLNKSGEDLARSEAIENAMPPKPINRVVSELEDYEKMAKRLNKVKA